MITFGKPPKNPTIVEIKQTDPGDHRGNYFIIAIINGVRFHVKHDGDLSYHCREGWFDSLTEVAEAITLYAKAGGEE